MEGIVDSKSGCAKYIYYHFDNRSLNWKINRDIHGAGKMEYFELNNIGDSFKIGDYNVKTDKIKFSKKQIDEVFTVIDQNDTVPDSSEKLINNFDN